MNGNYDLFSEIEIDAIGEILNISMGSAATSISAMLDKRVNITTPRVKVNTADKFQFESFEPAVGVEINYISGLSGPNVMILKKADIKVIVGLLLGMDYGSDDFELDEMSISAICEVMNQMMGASSTALSEFLNRTINISTPTSFSIKNQEEFKAKYYSGDNVLVTVYFNLMIEDLINSEFISVLPISLAKELVANLSVSEPEPAPIPQPQPVQAAPAPVPNPIPQMQRSASTRPAPAAQPPTPAVREDYVVREAAIAPFEREPSPLSGEQSTNLNLIMSVPLQITVEIGRTKRQIKDILEFAAGTIVDLNKPAGSRADVFVNGQMVAKGDVVVVDDFYGVRITEILSNSEIMKIL